MSFKWKTILGIALIEVVFLSFLVWQASRYIQNLGEVDIEKRVDDTVLLASAVLRDSIIAFDLATIDEQIAQIAGLDGVTYVELSGHGKVLSSANTTDIAISKTDNRIEDVDDGVYDTVHDIEFAGQTLGTLRLGFSVRDLSELTSTAQTRLYSIAALELILVALCSWLLARHLTKGLVALRETSERLEFGEAVEPIPGRGSDEIGSAIDAFNRMFATLLEREGALKDVNQSLTLSNRRLQEQEQEMWSLFDAAPDSIAVLDTQGHVMFSNRKLTRLLGDVDVQVVGHSLSEFLVNPEDERLRSVLSGQHVNARGYRCQVYNQAEKRLAVEINASEFRSGDEVRIILIIRDQTHEQALAEAAQLQERLKANLVDSSLDAIVTITGEGKVIDFSRSAETLFGWGKDEILGQKMEEFLIPEELRQAHQRGMAHFLATGEGPLIGQRVETKAVHRSGRVLAVELALTAVWVNNDVFVTAAIRDITVRKRREQELVEARAQAEDASLAKSRFLSYMSHEIRSPLNAVLGSLALIRERGNIQPEEHYYLDLAQESGDSLLKVVNEVLDFSKIEAGHVQFEKTPCSLPDLIQSVQAAILAKGIKPQVEMLTEVPRTLPATLLLDRDHLRQVLTILLDNAYKFTEEGSVAVVVAINEIPVPSKEGYLSISVTDTGPGVPPALVDTIFSEFEQTDATRDSGFGGTGLGLAIAKRLIAGMGGRIELESELGAGSVFRVEVPFEACSSPLPLPENKHQQTDLPRSGARVLLVDDVEANRIIGAELLNHRGFSVDVAQDGLKAVQLAGQTPYDVILMDIRMPGLNGLEATQRIRQSCGLNAGTPIIALTANAEKSEIQRCLQGGMDGFVSKPFNIDKLSTTIAEALSDKVTEVQNVDNTPTQDDDQHPLLSDDVIKQLSRDTSAENLPMMISVFINEIKKRLQYIDIACNKQDELEIREQAHALKSCAGTFGGLKLQEAARELEDLASRSNACSEALALERVTEIAKDTLVAYSEYRESLQAETDQADHSAQ
jgi:PAS domain S-box-containing protein